MSARARERSIGHAVTTALHAFRAQSTPCAARRLDAVRARAGRLRRARVASVGVEAVLIAKGSRGVGHLGVEDLTAERRLQRVLVRRGRLLAVQVFEVCRRDVCSQHLVAR